MPDDSPLSRDLPTVHPTVREAVAQYLQEKRATLKPDSLHIVEVALQAILSRDLDEPTTALSSIRIVVLSGLLRAKVSPQTGRKLSGSTFRRYLGATRQFVAWAAARWPPAAGGPNGPTQQHAGGSQQHRIGDLIRILRTDAGLTRRQLGDGTKVGAPALKSIELRRRLPTQAQLDQLLQAPAMAGLLAWAEKEGVSVEVAPELDPDPSGFRRVEGDKP